jgi:hypothetical protein
MILQTVKPRARWKDSGYGPYVCVTWPDLPGEYHGRSVDEAVHRANAARLHCMVFMKGAMGVRRRDA